MIFFLYSDQRNKEKPEGKENSIISTVHLMGDRVSQVQSLSNLAINNLVSFLNIDHEQPDSNSHCLKKRMMMSSKIWLKNGHIMFISEKMSGFARKELTPQIRK